MTNITTQCLTEDADNCFWDAELQGNGEGISFTSYQGVVTYDQPQKDYIDPDIAWPLIGLLWAITIMVFAISYRKKGMP